MYHTKHYPMNRIFIFIIASFFIVNFAISQTLSVGGVTFDIDTLENHKVGPGTQYTSIRLTTPSKRRIDVFFLKTDLTHPHIDIRAGLGRDSIYGGEYITNFAKRKSTEGNFYFAGTNGDFYDTGATYTGYPVSGNMVNGQIAKIPGSRNIFAYDADKRPHIGIMSYSGKITFGTEDWTITSVNHVRNTNALVLFNEHNGKVTRTNEHGTEVLVELLGSHTWGSNKTMRAKVTKIEKGKGSMSIPKGKAVLSGHGTSAALLNQLAVNDEIDIRLNLQVNGNSIADYQQMTGGDNYATMLLNGVVEQSSVWAEKHPRTGLGFTQDEKTLIFCVVDGRSVSEGATTKELAEIMKSGGAYTAFNMDGGGSTTMYIHEYGTYVNRVSGGVERAVANGLYVVATSPTDNVINELIAYYPSISVPMYGEFTPDFYGYNQYGVLLNTKVEGVTLSCPPELGEIVHGNKFIAGNQAANGYITATYNGNVTAQIAVNVVEITDIRIRLDSAVVDNRYDYPIEVIATTKGFDAFISPAALTWTVEDPEICSITDGILKAHKNGRTIITGSKNEVSDQLIIKVEIPEAAVMVADDMNPINWTMAASSFLKASLNQDNLPTGWNQGAVVNFTSNAGRAPYITLTNTNIEFYGLPDTLRLVMNTTGIALTRGIFSLKAKNDTKVATIEMNNFPISGDYNLDIPLSEVFDLSDKIIHPISFDNVKFYFENGSMATGQAFSLAIKEMQLVYKDYVSTGIPINKEMQIGVYPNPAQDMLYVKINQIESPTLQLYSLSGVLLKTVQAKQMNISELDQGSYLLKVVTREGSWEVYKVLKL